MTLLLQRLYPSAFSELIFCETPVDLNQPHLDVNWEILLCCQVLRGAVCPTAALQAPAVPAAWRTLCHIVPFPSPGFLRYQPLPTYSHGIATRGRQFAMWLMPATDQQQVPCLTLPLTLTHTRSVDDKDNFGIREVLKAVDRGLRRVS